MMVQSQLITNGTILTMDSEQPTAEAIAVIGDRIVAVGNREMVEASLPRQYTTLDLGGGTCLPGFNEAHNHMIGYGTALGHVEAGFPAVRSIEDIKRNVAERARSVPARTWIQGRGYDDNKLDEKRHPNRIDLDEAAPDHPVVIVNGSGHLCAVNTKALQLAGVDANTPDPEGGHIVRDEHGEATGVLHETAQQLVRGVIPASTLDDHIAALERCNNAYVAAGITSSQDAKSDDPLHLEAYQRAVQSGQLKLRTSMMVHHNLLDHLVGTGIKQGFGNDKLRVGPIKIFIDGSLIGRTAAVSQPFLEDPRDDNTGLLMMSEEEFQNIVWRAHSAGFQIAVHAIGDRGIEIVLDAYQKALDQLPRADHRHRIEHCGILRPDLIDRIATMGALAVSQPVFITEYGDGFIRHLGLNRTQLTYPFRTLLDAGIKLVFSSDCPVASFEPLKSIEVSVTERTGSGQSYALEEAISVEEALELYTVAGAYSTFEEHKKGKIKEGMLADFAILDTDPRQVDPDAISQIPVRQTIIGGESVYEA
jgi:predicted amidohydrolase YtcJ